MMPLKKPVAVNIFIIMNILVMSMPIIFKEIEFLEYIGQEILILICVIMMYRRSFLFYIIYLINIFVGFFTLCFLKVDFNLYIIANITLLTLAFIISLCTSFQQYIKNGISTDSA